MKKSSNSSDYHGEDRRTTIPSFIAIYGCDDRVLEFHRFHSLGNALGFPPIHQSRFAMFDIAEGARARADIAEHQERGGAAAPAFAQVRAHGFFTNCM